MESERLDLDKLEELAKAALERANAATKGPWHFHEGDLVNIDHQDVLVDWEEAYGPNENELGPDAKFVLAARQDVPELAAAVLKWIAYTRSCEERALEPCLTATASSRICERGTPFCPVRHKL